MQIDRRCEWLALASAIPACSATSRQLDPAHWCAVTFTECATAVRSTAPTIREQVRPAQFDVLDAPAGHVGFAVRGLGK